MQKLSALLVGCFLLGVSIPRPATPAAPQPPTIPELQHQYKTAVQAVQRLESELEQARRTLLHLKQQLDRANGAESKETGNEESGESAPKKYAEAIEALTKTIERTPQDATAYRNRGMAYIHLGHYPQALQDFTTALARNPQDAIAYNQRGIAHYQMGNYARALEDFTKAIARSPDLAEPYNNRGIVQRRLGNYAQAMKDLNRAAHLGLELAPPDLQLLRAEVRQAQERLHTAGFHSGPADGVPGAQTSAALRQYQGSQGLPITGLLDEATKHALGLPLPAPHAASEPPPRFVHQPHPVYPTLARQHGWDGTVTLRVELLPQGTVGAVEVAQSSGHPSLDTAAQEAVKTWTHQPATDQGTPVTRWVHLDVHFALEKALPD